MENVKYLEVFYRGRKVGTISLPDSGIFTFFSYDEEWLKDGFSISPFRLPLSTGLFQANKKYLFGLFGPFYDCLPDSWGNKVIDTYLKKQGISPQSINILTRLALLDSSSLGGFDFVPQIREDVQQDEMSIEDIRHKFDLLMSGKDISEEELSQVYARSSSTGGSRPKMNVLINDELWIVKFPGRNDSDDIGTMEFDYMEAAAECGLNVPPHKLIYDDKGIAYFACKRFDRDAQGKRIHRLSLAGLLETNIDFPQVDYITLLQTVRVLCPMDLEQAYGLMCFNLFAGNFDDHAENFSFLYDEQTKHYRLSPCYDLTTQPNLGIHQLGFGWKDVPTKTDLFALADKVGIGRRKAESIMQKVLAIVRKRLSKYYSFSSHIGRAFER